ncbi:MAG: hypothetical protein ABII71_02945 [Candidatus Micrarchaeota archaeon]
MAAIKSKASVQSSGPPPLQKRAEYNGPRPPPLPHKRRSASSRPSPFSARTPDSQPISGVRVVEGSQSPALEYTDESFHGKWGRVLPGVFRASCITGNFSTVIFRIRTADREPDFGLLGQIGRLIKRDNLVYVSDHAFTTSERDRIFVHLDQEKGLYEIFMHGVPHEMLDEAKNLVGCVAAYFHEVKEKPLPPL